MVGGCWLLVMGKGKDGRSIKEKYRKGRTRVLELDSGGVVNMK